MFSVKKLTIVCATFGVAVLLSACGGDSSGTAATAESAGSTTATTSTSTDSGVTEATGATTPTATGAGANSVAISWTPPTQNVDGTALTDLGAYKIYYGTSPDNLSDSIRVDSNVTSYMMTGLVSGTTYYFAITSINTVGTESDLSNVATKTV